MKVYTDLMSTGYYLGKSTEIFTTDELSSLYQSVKLDIQESFVDKKNNDWMYFITCVWPDNDENKNKSTPYDKLEEKLKLVAKEARYVQQSWFFKFYSAVKNRIITNHVIENKLKDYISKIYNVGNGTLEVNTSITYYRKNDFISVHRDGRNTNRICGLLIYLTPEEEYKPEYGGKLLLRPVTEKNINCSEEDYHLLNIQVEPIKHNMVILDFTKHNIYHAVEKCHEDFNRTAILSFVTLKYPSAL